MAFAKVSTADGEVIYERERPRDSQLVPEYVAAGITDLLQAAVQTGPAGLRRSGGLWQARPGQPARTRMAGFVGFSSGITTGVWMGRDDAQAVPGLQGGRAPARAFAAYMRYAVKDRPVEEFDTELNLPEWAAGA